MPGSLHGKTSRQRRLCGKLKEFQLFEDFNIVINCGTRIKASTRGTLMKLLTENILLLNYTTIDLCIGIRIRRKEIKNMAKAIIQNNCEMAIHNI